MRIFRLNIFLCVVALYLSLLSCGQDRSLEQALELAGDNRSELEKVLVHYQKNPADSLKYKAACFLIENMPGHYSHNDMAEARYYDSLDSIFTLYKGDNERVDSAYAVLAKQRTGISSKRISDLQYVTADYLIDNIERAFEVWQNGRWAKHVNFDDFCESILPYKAEDGQTLDNWRGYLAMFCSGNLTYLPYCHQYSHSAFRACEAVNQELIDSMKPRMYWYGGSYPFVLRLSTLMKMPHGTCDRYSLLTTSVMRAKGIPVFTDFTPQWPFRSLSHSWNVVLENSGRYIAFEGANTPMEKLFKKEQKMAKVFRETYAMNPELKKMLLSGQRLPSSFRTPFIKDVSDEYFVGSDVTLPVSRRHGLQYAFLSVFDNHNWIPVHWGKIKKNKVGFKNMDRDIIYLPVFYEKKAIIPFSDPFLLDFNGNALPIIPDTVHKQTLTLNRKFPVFAYQYEYGPRIIGGRFEAADNPDFKNSIIVHEIQEFSTESKAVTVNPATKAYRYWRFYPPDDVFCNIAEICFYERGAVKPSYGKVIGTIGSYRKEAGYTKEAVFDGDVLTFFDVPEASGCWIGMDFGKAVSIEKIIYTPRSDGNCIEIGDEYELVYWCDGKWKSLGKQKATDVTITFANCPVNALFLLHDLTKGMDERIFTYNNGIQVWW
jgi:hypothetical protein